MTLAAGDRTKPVVFQRNVPGTNDANEPIEAWTTYASVYADVSYGTGQERRATAQIGGRQTATIRVLRNALTAALAVTDRASFDDAYWDITSVVPLGRNEGIEITATRAA